MKLFTFHKGNDPENIIFQVRAENLAQAVTKAGVPMNTPYYSEVLDLELEVEFGSTALGAVEKVTIELSDLDREKIRSAQQFLLSKEILSDGSFVFTPTSEIKYIGDDFIPGSHEFIVSTDGVLYRAYDDIDSSYYFETESFNL